MKAPTKIGIPPNLRVLYVERFAAKERWSDNVRYEDGHYRLWLHTSDHVHGTFLRLSDDGSITRVTIRDDQGDQEDLIKPPD